MNYNEGLMTYLGIESLYEFMQEICRIGMSVSVYEEFPELIDLDGLDASVVLDDPLLPKVQIENLHVEDADLHTVPVLKADGVVWDVTENVNIRYAVCTLNEEGLENLVACWTDFGPEPTLICAGTLRVHF